MATIFEEYNAKFAGSRALWERARKLIPSGINHDARFINPFPSTWTTRRAAGSGMSRPRVLRPLHGHGSLILGHGHPAVLKALNEAVGRFTIPRPHAL